MVSAIADWLSILSFVISLYVAWSVKRIRGEMIDRVRLPQLVKAVKQSASRFQELIRTFSAPETQVAIRIELANCESILKMIRRKVDGPTRQTANSVVRLIMRFHGPMWLGYFPIANTEDDAWTIYARLLGLVTELDNFVKEQRIGA